MLRLKLHPDVVHQPRATLLTDLFEDGKKLLEAPQARADALRVDQSVPRPCAGASPASAVLSVAWCRGTRRRRASPASPARRGLDRVAARPSAGRDA